MRRPALILGAGLFTLLGLVAPVHGKVTTVRAQQEFVVLYERSTAPGLGGRAVRAAGGRVVHVNDKIGVATAVSSNPRFLVDVAASPVVAGAARHRPIGTAATIRPPREDVERMKGEQVLIERSASMRTPAGTNRTAAASGGGEPLATYQWNMRMIRATPAGSYALEPGDRRVRVGVIDTGIDASHPDIAPTFDRALSRNFTKDMPDIDGACGTDPDGSCTDSAYVDENGHGTHVAGIIGAARNGVGISGVAPNVTLVNLRAGQDSGFFFLQPTVDALTFAADRGIDVVNMSFFVDPWLFNCTNHASDSEAARTEQRTVVDATQRALDYAYARGVTLVGALGNDHTDLGAPSLDATSPDYPVRTNYTRRVDNSCLNLPAEGRNVLSVSALGPSTVKADYSNYGVEQTDLSAPGGYLHDAGGAGRPIDKTILSAYPKALAVASGYLDRRGRSTTPLIVRSCGAGKCAYYQYLQGTSMAAPHAAGVAALIVSRYGADNRDGFGLSPASVEKQLRATATDRACPNPRLYSYADIGRNETYDAYCAGPTASNGFYGDGIVDARRAVEGSTLR